MPINAETQRRRGAEGDGIGSTEDVLRWIETEISAGMVLIPRNQMERLYNQGCKRSLDIVRSYAKGEGLFQMTRNLPPA